MKATRFIMVPGLVALSIATATAKIDLEAPASDQVKTKAGQVILGQVVEPSPKGTVLMIVRRAWAEKAVPDLYKRWKADQGPRDKKAREQRKARLESWKRQRSRDAQVEAGDAILAYLESEIERLDTPGEGEGGSPPPLMYVSFRKADVKEIVKRPASATKLLRLAWSCSFENAETGKVIDLTQSLEGRGFDVPRAENPTLDDMLPIPSETEEQWLLRRAATEVKNDRGLAFVRMGGMIMPDMVSEMRKAQPRGAFMMPQAGAFAGGFGFPGSGGFDSSAQVADRLREVASRGRVGAVVTTQDVGANLDAASAEMTLWVRRPDGRWTKEGDVATVVKAADIKDDEVAKGGNGNMASATSFSFSSSFGFGPGGTTQTTKQSHPRLGAAGQKALDQVRTQFGKRIDKLALELKPR